MITTTTVPYGHRQYMNMNHMQEKWELKRTEHSFYFRDGHSTVEFALYYSYRI